VAALLAALAAGPGASGTGAAQRPLPSERLLQSVELLRETGAPGVVVLVRRGGRSLVLARGVADRRTGRTMRGTDRFRIGSLTKSFVAAVVLQLVGERVLRLDDSVERWLPGLVPGGAAVTVHQLLNHTSGLRDHTDDERVLRPYRRGDYGHRWPPRRLVSLAAGKGLLFPPGSRWAYSSTNYVLLGLIVEAASGRSLAHELERRLFEPLGLRSTSFAVASRLEEPYARGYGVLVDPPVRDLSAVSPSPLWAAGAIVSTAADVARFYRALLSGRVLRPRLLAAMETTVPIAAGDRYGLGLMRSRLPCGVAWGHTGTFFGYTASAFASGDGRRQVVVLANRAPLSGWAQHVLERDVVEAGFCGR
jgi:D-alanyl-D-alanine carboxypeptidase